MEEHLPTGWGNWAEISLALITGFTVFGEVFRRYLNGRITTHTAAVDRKLDITKTDLNNKLSAASTATEGKVIAASIELYKKLDKEKGELEGRIARERFEIDAEIDELSKDLSEKIAREGRAVGEGIAAIREHTKQIELWVRDNLTRDTDFKAAMIHSNDYMNSLNIKLDRLIDRLLDKKDKD